MGAFVIGGTLLRGTSTCELLQDGETVHNAFFDRRFKPQGGDKR